jgi:hypothetical protein
MFFTLLLGLSALLVAGTAAYFSVLGIATLFSGSYYEVIIMAGSLEFGKLIATSFLYRYWKIANGLLRFYLIVAVIILMGITSMGIFGYLSAAYQVNSANFAQIESQISLLEQQKEGFSSEIDQNNSRINTLNESRASQEKRLTGISSKSAQPIYKDIEKSGEEIQRLNERAVTLQQNKSEKDKEIIALKTEISKSKDIGTFKFVADSINKPLDVVVTAFICVLICVFDPLAVALVLAFNVATKKPKKKEDILSEIPYSDKDIDGLKEYEKYEDDKRKIKFSGVKSAD